MVAGTPIPNPTSGERRVRYTAYGAAAALMFDCRAPEVVLSGPAGTGKSRACLEYVHRLLWQYPRARALAIRKTLTSLAASGLVTFQEKVLVPGEGVAFFGGSKSEPAQYRYPNGSRLVVGGLDKPTKALSTEYDLIYVQQAEELSRAEWETLTTRLRNGVVPWQQLIGDCNPDAPTHWLKQRADSGATVMLESRHEDNPAITPEYLAKLDALTGVRYLRLRKGIWAAAEGLVYEGWDRAVHVIDRFPIPAECPRYWAVDFGYTNPFVWAAWAADPDGRLYRYREIYRTQRLVEDHARDILAITAKEPRPRAFICDHDAEGRATLERVTGIRTTPARKAIRAGVQAVAARLRPAGDGKPRLCYLRDSLVEADSSLREAGKPTCTEDEVEGYVWDTSAGRKQGEEPVDRDNHGMDMTRYLVMHLDGRRSFAPL